MIPVTSVHIAGHSDVTDTLKGLFGGIFCCGTLDLFRAVVWCDTSYYGSVPLSVLIFACFPDKSLSNWNNFLIYIFFIIGAQCSPFVCFFFLEKQVFDKAKLWGLKLKIGLCSKLMWHVNCHYIVVCITTIS